VNAVFALGDHLENFVDPHFAGVIDFQGAPGQKAAIEDREDDGIKERFVLRIKRTIDEYTDAVLILSHWTPAVAAHGGGRQRLF